MLFLLLLLSVGFATTWPGSDGADEAVWQRLATGVEWTDLATGQGPQVVVGARVEVHYTGMLADGSVFDSSVERGEAFGFRIGEHLVIRGWEDGLVGAAAGTRRRLVIPPDQGYGDRAAGRIPPGSTLYFEVEVIAVHPPRVPPDQPTPVDPDLFKRRGSGLMIADIAKGAGSKPTRDERICIDYTAWYEGRLVQHTFDREECLWIRFQPGQAVDGLIEGLATMREGGVRQLQVPAHLRQGAVLDPDLPRKGTMLYEVSLIHAMTRVR